MKSHHPPKRILSLFCGLPLDRFFHEVSEEDCPVAVAETARKFAGNGRIERILKSRRNRGIFHVEIELNNQLERSLQISKEGKLLSQVDRIRESELPQTVQNAVTG
ncbi:MAG: hypothetical protein AAF491_01210 [Verrucomicrobiota bacterium]